MSRDWKGLQKGCNFLSFMCHLCIGSIFLPASIDMFLNQIWSQQIYADDIH